MTTQNNLLKFSVGGNSKLPKHIVSFSIPSGYSCPGAHICKTTADPSSGVIKDGPHQTLRCFSASSEAAFSSVRQQRWYNYTKLRQARTTQGIKNLILRSIEHQIPTFTLMRIHIGGDFYSQSYFDAWLEVAEELNARKFYAYTKSIPFWANRITEIPTNLNLIASKGGKFDHLIDRLSLKSAHIVTHPDEAKALNLEVDHDDSHAYGDSDMDFALLIHGPQPAGSKAAAAQNRLKKEKIQYAYSK